MDYTITILLFLRSAVPQYALDDDMISAAVSGHI